MLKKMVKLPKEMQKKEKSKPTRPQATKKREGRPAICFQTDASPNAATGN